MYYVSNTWRVFYTDDVIDSDDDGDEGRIMARLTEGGSVQVEGRDREVERYRGGQLCQFLLGGTSREHNEEL